MNIQQNNTAAGVQHGQHILHSRLYGLLCLSQGDARCCAKITESTDEEKQRGKPFQMPGSTIIGKGAAKSKKKHRVQRQITFHLSPVPQKCESKHWCGKCPTKTKKNFFSRKGGA